MNVVDMLKYLEGHMWGLNEFERSLTNNTYRIVTLKGVDSLSAKQYACIERTYRKAIENETSGYMDELSSDVSPFTWGD